MRWFIRILPALAVFLCLTAESSADGDLAPNNEGNNESILVLLSGDVLQGQVSRLDDRYLVVLPTGRIFVPENNVEIVCKSLDEAYRYRKSRMGHGQAQDHAELAQWCLRHGLDAAAERELQIARQLNPQHPIVELAERQLAASRLAHHPSGDKPTPETDAEVTPQQLEDFAAGLPAGTVEAFTRVVQPLLLNRCVVSGCHTERSKNEFRLERPRPGVPLGRISTQRNLLATLKLVDGPTPEQCELLSPKRCPHRLKTEAVQSLSKTGQYRYLVAWVTLLTRQQVGASATPAVAQARFPQTPPETIRSGPPTVARPGLSDSVRDDPPKAASHLAGSAGPAPPNPFLNIPEATTAEPLRSADPFDPAVFNRKYGTAAPPAAVPVQSEKIPPPSPFFGK